MQGYVAGVKRERLVGYVLAVGSEQEIVYLSEQSGGALSNTIKRMKGAFRTPSVSCNSHVAASIDQTPLHAFPPNCVYWLATNCIQGDFLPERILFC